MGHLTRLANDIVNAQEKGENVEIIKTLVSGELSWQYLLIENEFLIHK